MEAGVRTIGCVLRACAVVVVVALAAAWASPARAAEPGVVSDLTWTGTWSEQDRSAAALGDLGAQWAKISVDWNAAEPLPGVRDGELIAFYDRALALLRARGIRVVALVTRSPAWARDSDDVEAPPRDPADLARFLRFLADRWGGKVRAWEIWNEPNTERFWPGGPNAAAYAALLRSAYVAVKASAPGARVVFGGVANLAPGARRFISDAYAAGAKGYFDVLGWHAYTRCGEDPEIVRYSLSGRVARSSFTGYRTIRDDLVYRYGDPKPIWLTEFGWSTSTQTCTESWTSGVSEQLQAQYLFDAFAALEHDPYVQVALWYNLRNNWWEADRDEIESRFGLLTSGYRAKPAYWSFQAYAAQWGP